MIREVHQISRAALLQFSAVLLLAFGCNAGAESRISVAVMPFSASIDNEELKGLDRALSEMLITDLTALQSIEVVERSRLDEVFKEIQLGKDGFINPSTAATIGKGIGAKTVLTGSFFAKGDKLRIDARLIHVETGTVLLAEEITGSAEDPFELEKKLQKKLIEAMGLRLSALEKAEISTKPAAGGGAAAAFGRAQTLKDAGDEEAARREAQQALRLAPDFNQARDLLTSLEERVVKIEEDVEVVKEVRIKRIKESKDDRFIGGFLESNDLDVRAEAVVAIRSREEELTQMALASAEEISALDPLDPQMDQERYHQLILLNCALVGKLSDQNVLANLVRAHSDPMIKTLALANIRDEDVLVDLFGKGLGSVDLQSYRNATIAGKPITLSIDHFWNLITSDAKKRICKHESILELCKAGKAEFVAQVADDSAVEGLAGNSAVPLEVRHEAQRRLNSPSDEKLKELAMSESGDQALFLAARVSDQAIVTDITLNHPDPAVARKLVAHIKREDLLLKIIDGKADDESGLLAVYQLSEPASLEKVRANSPNPRIIDAVEKMLAILSLSDMDKVKAVADHSYNDEFQSGIVRTIKDEEVLKQLAASPQDYKLLRGAAHSVVDCITNVVFLRNLILTLKATDSDFRRYVFERLDKLPFEAGQDEFMIHIATNAQLKWSDSNLVEPEFAVRKQAFMRINDLSKVRADYVDSSSEDVQSRMAEQLGDSYVNEAIELAIQQKRFAPPSLIMACVNRRLLQDYYEAINTWDTLAWGNPYAVLAERAIYSKIQDPAILVRSALENFDPGCRDISLAKISDKALLDKIATESRFFSTQQIAKEKLARLQ